MSLFSPKTYEVTYLDGRKEMVALRRLSLRQMYTFIELLDGKDPASLVSLCTGRPVEWFDTLEDDSGAGLSKLCNEENFPRATRLAQTDPLAGLKIAPFYRAAVNAMDAATALGTHGSFLSHVQRQSASAAATSEPASTSPSTNSSPSSEPQTVSEPKTS